MPIVIQHNTGRFGYKTQRYPWVVVVRTQNGRILRTEPAETRMAAGVIYAHLCREYNWYPPGHPRARKYAAKARNALQGAAGYFSGLDDSTLLG